MVDKYFNGQLPGKQESGEFDDDLISLALETPIKAEKYIDNLQFSNALVEIWKLVSRTNKYIDETTPWILAKEEEKKSRLATVLYNLLESIRFISIPVSYTHLIAIPESTISLKSLSFSSWEPSHQWILSGWHIAAISSTQACNFLLVFIVSPLSFYFVNLIKV